MTRAANDTKPKRYVTQGCLTRGKILLKRGKITESGSFSSPPWRIISKSYHHATESEARDAAERLRKKKIVSLKQQLKSLEALTFTVLDFTED